MTSQAKANPGYKVWQLALAIVALGVVLRLGLGSLPEPDDATEPLPAEAERRPADQPAADRPTAPNRPAPAVVAVLPFDLNGEVPGPLLTSILQHYLPDSTADHADTLRDTLPPGEDPRMIVILPEEGGVVF